MDSVNESDLLGGRPLHPLRSSWLAGWTYTGGVLRIVQLDGVELFANAPSWAPGLLSAAPSPGRFVRRHIMPRVFRRVPAPAAPEPDLTGALLASLELERARREPFAAAVSAYERQFLEIAAGQTRRLEAIGRTVAP